MTAHFADEPAEPVEATVTLCGLPIEGILWRNNPKADCVECCNVWHQRGWSFPLPELVVTDA